MAAEVGGCRKIVLILGFSYVSQIVSFPSNSTEDISFIIKPTRFTNFTNLFWHETVHVSDSSFVHC
jgi:hypothetical protein